MSQVNLKEKSVVELKAFAFDLQSVVQQYSQALQQVQAELAQRGQEEAAAAANAGPAQAPASQRATETASDNRLVAKRGAKK